MKIWCMFPLVYFAWFARVFYTTVWKTRYSEKFSAVAMIARGSSISVSSTRNPRYAVLTSTICKSTMIELDLSKFGEAMEITFGFVSAHR